MNRNKTGYTGYVGNPQYEAMTRTPGQPETQREKEMKRLRRKYSAYRVLLVLEKLLAGSMLGYCALLAWAYLTGRLDGTALMMDARYLVIWGVGFLLVEIVIPQFLEKQVGKMVRTVLLAGVGIAIGVAIVNFFIL